jgi:hypothetical protein
MKKKNEKSHGGGSNMYVTVQCHVHTWRGSTRHLFPVVEGHSVQIPHGSYFSVRLHHSSSGNDLKRKKMMVAGTPKYREN